jgi:cytochrome c55X
MHTPDTTTPALRRGPLFSVLLASVLAALVGAPLQGALAADGEIAPDGLSDSRQRDLFHLLKQDCGSCHGMTLKGGLGPALTAERLAGRSDELLVATIRYGRLGTPMPPFGPLLTDAEIDWLVQTLRSGRAE